MAQPIDYTNLICSFLTRNRNVTQRRSLRISSDIKTNIQPHKDLEFEDIPDVALFEVIAHLDVVQIARLWSTSKRFWNLRKQDIINRIEPYKRLIKNKQWNKGLSEAASKADWIQIVYFMEKGADSVNAGLSNACSSGNKHIVDYFLNLGANNWNDAIAHAAKRRNRELVDYLIKKAGPAPLVFEEALYESARSGDEDLVQFFLQKMNGTGFHREEAMSAAAAGGNKKIVEFFISRSGSCFWNGGLIAACREGHKELAEWFWNKGARDVDMALAFAVIGNRMEMVQWLISKRLKINWNRGLEWAVKGNLKEMVELCLKKGATDPFLGFAAAVYGGHLHYCQYFLMRWPVAFMGTDLNSFIPLAAEHDNREVLEYLLSIGATNFNAGVKAAVTHGHLSQVQFWEKYTQLPAYEGFTIAAENGHLSLVKYFLKKGVHTKTVDRGIQIARMKDHPRVVQWLEAQKEQLKKEQSQKKIPQAKKQRK